MPRCASVIITHSDGGVGDRFRMAAERKPRVAPRSGSHAKALKMTAMQARHGPARPAVRSWLASFLVDMFLLR